MKIKNDQIHDVEFFEMKEKEQYRNGNNEDAAFIPKLSKSNSSDCSSINTQNEYLVKEIDRNSFNNSNIASIGETKIGEIKSKSFHSIKLEENKESNYNIYNNEGKTYKSLYIQKFKRFHNKYNISIGNFKKKLNDTILHAKNIIVEQIKKQFKWKPKFSLLRVKHKIIDKQNKKKALCHNVYNKNSNNKFNNNNDTNISGFAEMVTPYNKYTNFISKKKKTDMLNTKHKYCGKGISRIFRNGNNDHLKEKKGLFGFFSGSYISYLFGEKKEAKNEKKERKDIDKGKTEKIENEEEYEEEDEEEEEKKVNVEEIGENEEKENEEEENEEEENEEENEEEENEEENEEEENEEEENERNEEEGREEKIKMQSESWEINKRFIQNGMNRNNEHEHSGIKYCDNYDSLNVDKKKRLHIIKNRIEDFNKKDEDRERDISFNNLSKNMSNKNSFFKPRKKVYIKKYGYIYESEGPEVQHIKYSNVEQNSCYSTRKKSEENFRSEQLHLLSNDEKGNEIKNGNICGSENILEIKKTHMSNKNKNECMQYLVKEKRNDNIYRNNYDSINNKTYWNDEKSDLLLKEMKKLIQSEKSNSLGYTNSDDKDKKKNLKDDTIDREKERQKEREIKGEITKSNELLEKEKTKEHFIINNADFDKLKEEHISTVRLIDNLINDISRVSNCKSLKVEAKTTTTYTSDDTVAKSEINKLDKQTEEKEIKKTLGIKDEHDKLYITILYDEESLIEALDKLRISKKKQKKIEKNIFYKCKDNEVKDAINILNYKDGNKLLLEKFNVRFQYSQIRCLRDTQWLNDEVINFYFCMLQEHNTSQVNHDKSAQGVFPKIFTFSTFFFQSLTSNGYNYKNVAKWTRRKKIDIFSFDLILIPLHVRGNHWTLGVVNIKEKNIKLYDSLNLQNKNFFEYMKRYIADEAKDKKNQIIDLSQWTCDRDGNSEQGIPLQQNGYDCGVFTCMFAKCLTFGREFDFNQEDIRDIRFKMVYDISKGRLEF